MSSSFSKTIFERKVKVVFLKEKNRENSSVCKIDKNLFVTKSTTVLRIEAFFLKRTLKTRCTIFSFSLLYWTLSVGIKRREFKKFEIFEISNFRRVILIVLQGVFTEEKFQFLKTWWIVRKILLMFSETFELLKKNSYTFTLIS